ncbi:MULTISPECIES: hypothetical protein [unclassified Microcoleus]|uniref:hypothetical protein n=1 Tax=unclassified Microcoleus TaxID=2642155 RepID=UPI002FD4E56A
MAHLDAQMSRDLLSRRGFHSRMVAAAASLTTLRTVTIPSKYPAPSFAIGDTVADTWIDESEVDHTEVGEIVGICWHPINQRWEYHINWLSGKGPDNLYPCFDGHLTSHEVGAELRLVEKG